MPDALVEKTRQGSKLQSTLGKSCSSVALFYIFLYFTDAAVHEFKRFVIHKR